MNIDAYLERIGYRGPLDPSLTTLRGLHLAHLYAVPFENLDIHWGRPIRLDDAALFDKIVTRRRGGFCYELNGLFCALLRELGFPVTMLSAEVARQDGGYSPEFDHLALRVDLHDAWLVDVGFGDGFRVPIRLNDACGHTEDSCAYLIIIDGDYSVLMRRKADGDWTPQYRFTLQAHGLEDFAARCVFHQTSPESHFMQERLCSLALPEGRVTLSGVRLIVSTELGRTERVVGDHEYAQVLRERFAVIE